ncbi:hypothetical protein [Pseudomonas sp. PSKL.D1]|uniref:hypothetical protein n=1 Tax=Pseudomonas sp. PSKL.D1 TaxID=3029060 RepID=UPI00238165CB|nr:hypothetical protein [Pseudomonas sp. PSKL.D1]WDY56683.1 hypothetical protein PVV54_19140 [Pseudomonas sp. PSKL.D1]
MIQFEEAIGVARENVTKLVRSAINIELEGAIISDDAKQYEITFSYDLNTSNDNPIASGFKESNLRTLADLLSKRKEYKVFLVDSQSGSFKGFKSQKEA